MVIRYEWDPAKARANHAKHGVRFGDAVVAFSDDAALTMKDPHPEEERFVTMGMDGLDFSRAKRGALDPVSPGKTRITIRLDDDVLDWFRDQADSAGGGNYQTMINAALREYVSGSVEPLEDTLRRVVREELDRSA